MMKDMLSHRAFSWSIKAPVIIGLALAVFVISSPFMWTVVAFILYKAGMGVIMSDWLGIVASLTISFVIAFSIVTIAVRRIGRGN